MSEEMSTAGPATTEEPDLAGPSPAASPSNAATDLSVEANSNDISEARLYLAAMTHFFSGFSGDCHGDSFEV
jgi:hypothetical protein